MSAQTATGVALRSFRFLAFAVLLYSLFYLAMTRGKWYRERFFANDELDYDISSEANMRTSHNQRALFLVLFPVIAAALGGFYEAVWKHSEGKSKDGATPNLSPARSIFSNVTSIVHFNFRPLGRFSP